MSNTDVPLRVDVPMTLYPDVLIPQADVLNQERTVGPRALAAGREALATLHRTYSAIEDAERALGATAKAGLRRQKPNGQSQYLGDIRLVDGRLRRFTGHEDELAAAATEAVVRATASVDSRLDLLATYRKALAKRVEDALAYPAGQGQEGLAIAAQIRTHVAGLANDQRTGFLQKAVENGDRQTVAAILGAPPYLSGLTEKKVKTIRAHAAQEWVPTDAAQLEAVGTTIARVEDGKRALEQRRDKAAALADGNVATAGRKLEELKNG